MSPQAERYKSPARALAREATQMMVLRPILSAAIKWHVHGLEHLEGLESPFIVVANHSSHFDGPLVWLSMPRRLSRTLSTAAAADYFFDKWYTAAGVQLLVNAFPVDRVGKARPGKSGHRHTGMAKQLLSQGVSLLIFPEASRSRTGGMGPFNAGSAAMAISLNVPIVPVAIVGAFAAWPSKASRWVPGRPDVHIVYGSPMRAQPGEIAHVFMERVRRQVIELHDSTARAYKMPTQADMMHLLAIEKATPDEQTPASSKAPASSKLEPDSATRPSESAPVNPETEPPPQPAAT